MLKTQIPLTQLCRLSIQTILEKRSKKYLRLIKKKIVAKLHLQPNCKRHTLKTGSECSENYFLETLTNACHITKWI